MFDDCFESVIVLDLYIGCVYYLFCFQFEGCLVVDVVVDVFFVGQYLVDGFVCLWLVKIGEDVFIIEGCGDFCFGVVLDDEYLVEMLDNFDFFRWFWFEYDLVGLQVFLFFMIEDCFGLVMFIDEIVVQVKVCGIVLMEIEVD